MLLALRYPFQSVYKVASAYNTARRRAMSHSYLVVQPTTNIDTTIKLVETLQSHNTPHAFFTAPSGVDQIRTEEDVEKATKACFSPDSKLIDILKEHEGALIATGAHSLPLLQRMQEEEEEADEAKPVIASFDAAIAVALTLRKPFGVVAPDGSTNIGQVKAAVYSALGSAEKCDRYIENASATGTDIEAQAAHLVERGARTICCSDANFGAALEGLMRAHPTVTFINGTVVGAHMLDALIASSSSS